MSDAQIAIVGLILCAAYFIGCVVREWRRGFADAADVWQEESR